MLGTQRKVYEGRRGHRGERSVDSNDQSAGFTLCVCVCVGGVAMAISAAR